MRCYICDTSPRPGSGLMRPLSEAVGVCTTCGVGACRAHGRKAAAGPFQCAACAAAAVTGAERAAPPRAHRELVGAAADA